MPFSTGGVTKNTFRYGPEVHKLHLEFPIGTNVPTDGIHRGQPVKFDTDGGIIPLVEDDNEALMIGVSIHEGKSAYGDLIVVAMRGYTVLDAVASGDVTPGPVAYKGYAPVPAIPDIVPQPNISDPGARPSWNTTDPLTQGDNLFKTAGVTSAIITSLEAPAVHGWSMTAGTIADGQPILVIIKN